MNVEINIAGKLFPNLFTMITQLISTGILLYFFKKFLWGPLQTYLGKRAEYIEANISEAKDMSSKAKLHMEESEKLAKAGALEYRDVVERAKQDAHSFYLVSRLVFSSSEHCCASYCQSQDHHTEV